MTTVTGQAERNEVEDMTVSTVPKKIALLRSSV
jgi:hypothetical protein